MLPVLRNHSSALVTQPWNRLSSIFDHFDRMLDEAFVAPLNVTSAWTSFPMSLWEDENALYVEIDAPGVSEKDIELTVQDGDLIIRGERKAPEKKNGYDNRLYGRFAQRIALPAGVDTNKVEAKLANGVLTVTCPKYETAKPRRIAITAGQSE
ncbi:MAG: Hsp20/alpha crystallin family protein [Gemmataceae bacterium]|nr:Hsp20/alpha crystallin family protein [Gemmata sp.]MDW8199517.1 Hsp20/alpha crystallin family protein [Gemmataceae bacterium]